jgi:hypothetical protein
VQSGKQIFTLAINTFQVTDQTYKFQNFRKVLGSILTVSLMSIKVSGTRQPIIWRREYSQLPKHLVYQMYLRQWIMSNSMFLSWIKQSQTFTESLWSWHLHRKQERFSLKLRQLYTWHSFHRRLGGPQSRCGHGSEETEGTERKQVEIVTSLTQYKLGRFISAWGVSGQEAVRT